jgi:hypothetical protein
VREEDLHDFGGCLAGFAPLFLGLQQLFSQLSMLDLRGTLLRHIPS